MASPESIANAIKDISDFVLRYAVTLAAVGALSMALLEAAKSLLSARDRFQKGIVREWIASAGVPAGSRSSLHLEASTDEQYRGRIYVQLIRLTTGEIVGQDALGASVELVPWDVSPKHALFALELERMMGQIQDAADSALNNPTLYPDLYLFLTAGAQDDDVQRWYGLAASPPIQTSEDRQAAKLQADTYSRLRQLIRRRLDALQLTARYRWQSLNQITSVALGAVLLFVANVMQLGWTIPSGKFWELVLVSILGGVVAPVAKDLVMALKQVRSSG